MSVFTSVLADGLSLEFLSNSKFPQVSRTLLSILGDLNNLVVWMISTCPLISKSSSPFNNPSVTVLITPITISISVTFMFHSFFQFFSKFQVRVLLFTFFHFYSFVIRDCKVHKFSFFVYYYKFWSSGRDSVIVFTSKSHILREEQLR